ncbi:MAG: hypothetical protein ABIO02_02520 [Patescibacteria group bacterium]
MSIVAEQGLSNIAEEYQHWKAPDLIPELPQTIDQFYSEITETPYKSLQSKIKEVDEMVVAGKLPADWYLLKGTGFHVDTQLEQLQTHLRTNPNGSIPRWLDQVALDMGYFDTEYFAKRDFIPYMQALVPIEGKMRLVAPNYGNAIVADIYDSVERDGATKRAYAGVIDEDNPENNTLGIEDYLINAPDEAIVVRTSPTGWSGYEGFDFPDTQTFVMQKLTNRNGTSDIKCFTIITNMDEEANKRFLRSLGADMQKIDAAEPGNKQLAVITETNVFIEGSSIEDVLLHLEEASGNKTRHGKSFDTVRDNYEYHDKLLLFDESVLQIIDQYRSYAKWVMEGTWAEDMDGEVFAPHIFEELGKGLAYSVLEMSKLQKDVQESSSIHFSRTQARDYQSQAHQLSTIGRPLSPQFIHSPEELMSAIKYTESREGCAGGGKKDPLKSSSVELTPTSYISSVNGYRNLIPSGGGGLSSNSSSEALKTECVTCPFCSETVDAEIEGGKLKCPKCKKKAGDEPT